ncbi:tyrosinase family protein [Rhizobium sp. BT-175]|uniref:tyrosinase family protein n=1 Tax=Rhizobium sp. BT-175 TaxID=2986929 RepID=UPI00223674FB|nr:tyrosinase family protein [Rhizobium sp. BT-175]MCV9945133.1 tyrosinase family protein [Rhizobium sp. BT-175]
MTWRPVQAELRLIDAPAGSADIDVIVSSATRTNGGRMVFADTLTHQGQASLPVTLPASGAPVTIFVGGEFQTASASHGDVAIEVREAGTNQILGSRPVMVRIRKNANGLTATERDRFLAALAALNGSGTGPYRDFRDMHVAGPPDDEAHGGPGFLPWHRAYLLDFERSLQKIDAEVSLPYWRFDQAAPKVFNRSFMGVPDQNGQVQFSAGHPLLSWVAQGSAGILRGRGVGPQTVPGLRDETQTIGLAGPNGSFASFAGMQGNPHGRAHTSHLGGWITIPSTAPRDPLFFLLHCNVDRLWAKWQWVATVHDPADPRAFTPSAGFPAGHRLADELWPWSGPLQPPRPTTAPGGPLADSPMTPQPGALPRIRDMIDYLGTMQGAGHHAFAYDDVPFQI